MPWQGNDIPIDGMAKPQRLPVDRPMLLKNQIVVLGTAYAPDLKSRSRRCHVAIPVPFSPVNHIENRRLHDVAYGKARLESWERVHIHECHVCQGVFYLFVIHELVAKPPFEEKAS